MESGAGWVPFFMEHMDGEFEKPVDAPLCKAKPSEYRTCGRAISLRAGGEDGPYARLDRRDNMLYARTTHRDSEWP
jgi:hypothetical protein